jgi:hypothetical protein
MLAPPTAIYALGPGLTKKYVDMTFTDTCRYKIAVINHEWGEDRILLMTQKCDIFVVNLSNSNPWVMTTFFAVVLYWWNNEGSCYILCEKNVLSNIVCLWNFYMCHCIVYASYYWFWLPVLFVHIFLEVMWSVQVISSCSTTDTCRYKIVVINHEWGEDRILLMTQKCDIFV